MGTVALVIARNDISGDLQLTKNKFGARKACLTTNRVFGNLQLQDNAQGTVELRGNYVESALQCQDNDAVITGRGNIAGDLECPALQ